MGYNIRLCNIESPNDFTISYKTGRTPGDVTTGFTSYGTTYSGGTTEIIISGVSLSFDTQYWFKLTDVETSGYTITNIYSNEEGVYSFHNPSPTPSVTPTTTPISSLSPTPSISVSPTPTLGITLSETPTVTPTSTITPSETPTPSVTPTTTPIASLSQTPTLTPTPSPDIRTDVEVEVYAFSSNIRYEVTLANDACYYSGTCAGGRQILYTGVNAITNCDSIGECVNNTTIRSGGGDIYITWEKTRNSSGTCTTGPCNADDTTAINVYINGIEATSFGSPFNYTTGNPVTGNVLLTGITYLDTIKVYIGEG